MSLHLASESHILVLSGLVTTNQLSRQSSMNASTPKSGQQLQQPLHWGAPDQDMQTTDPGLCALSEDFKFPRPSTPNDDMHHIEGDG